MSSANFSFFRKKMERRDLLYYPQQGATVSSQVSLYSYLSAHHLALLKTRIPYLACVPEYSVTFLSGKSYSPDISLCKKAGLSDLRSLLEGMAYHAARLRLWGITARVTSPDNLIILYLSSMSSYFFNLFLIFLLFPCKRICSSRNTLCSQAQTWLHAHA